MQWPGSTTYAQRVGLMKLMVPEPFEQPGTVLYVGAHAGRFEASKELKLAGNEITLLEVWEDALEAVKKVGRFEGRVTHFVLGDVCKLDKVDLPYEWFDYSFWLHGPEHVRFTEAIAAMRDLEAVTRKVVVLACPWGRRPHGWKVNPHNKHLSWWLPVDFARLGYEVACLGPKEKSGGQLMAWKRMENGSDIR